MSFAEGASVTVRFPCMGYLVWIDTRWFHPFECFDLYRVGYNSDCSAMVSRFVWTSSSSGDSTVFVRIRNKVSVMIISVQLRVVRTCCAPRRDCKFSLVVNQQTTWRCQWKNLYCRLVWSYSQECRLSVIFCYRVHASWGIFMMNCLASIQSSALVCNFPLFWSAREPGAFHYTQALARKHTRLTSKQHADCKTTFTYLDCIVHCNLKSYAYGSAYITCLTGHRRYYGNCEL
jgi:hypothetical protein